MPLCTKFKSSSLKTCSIKGGFSINFLSPFTICVNFSIAFWLVRLRALAFTSSSFFLIFSFFISISSIFIFLYHKSRVFILVVSFIVSLYDCTALKAYFRHSFLPMPIDSPPSIILAASRFKSHSHGPFIVSSKSFISKSKVPSGEPNIPKLPICASPQI